MATSTGRRSAKADDPIFSGSIRISAPKLRRSNAPSQASEDAAAAETSPTGPDGGATHTHDSLPPVTPHDGLPPEK